jgi:hydrogenase maturation protease
VAPETCPPVGATVIIGVGNPFRGDDGVGPEVVRQLGTMLEGVGGPVRLIEATGEGASLIEAWQGASRTILIDAVQPAAGVGEGGQIVRLDAQATELPANLFHYSTHAFSVAEAVELSRVLGTLPPFFRIYGIVGASFAAGVGLTPAVAGAAGIVTAEIRQLLGKQLETGRQM